MGGLEQRIRQFLLLLLLIEEREDGEMQDARGFARDDCTELRESPSGRHQRPFQKGMCRVCVYVYIVQASNHGGCRLEGGG
jgi:hypothetical protein